MLTNKEKTLVQHLLKHREDYTTSMELGELLSCSDRTIRTYIRNISQELADVAGVELVSKQGQGYQLRVQDEETFKQLTKEFGQAEVAFSSLETTDINDRHSYILNKLLLEQKKLFFDDLAEELFVSRSTLSSDFKKIRKDLAPYHLKIESRANKGVYVEGEEQQIRRFIMDYFFSSGFFQTLYQYVDEELVYGKINFEALTVIVLDECREAKLKLSDFVIQNLVVHLALAIRRLAEGFQISAIDEAIGDQYVKEFEVARKIMDRISLATKLHFPEEEVAYIALHLISKGKIENGSSHDLDDVSRIRQELNQALEGIGDQHFAGLQQDFQLLEGLLTHLTTLYLRSSNGIVLENPLLEDIKTNYPQAFELAKETLEIMPSFQDFVLSDDEIAYVALHFMAAQERYKEQFKFNVLVICATGYGSAQMLRSRIENELRQYVTISDVIGYYEITDEKLKGIDFIISSIDLSNLIFSVPVYTTSVFLKEDELADIRQKIEQLDQVCHQNKQKADVNHQDISQLFDQMFSADYFISYDTSIPSKDQILEELVDSLSRHEQSPYKERMLELMTQRERLSSILFSETIAVPHPIKPVSETLKIAVALIPSGLRWEDEADGIKLVFLPSLSIGSNDGLKTITNVIVDLVDQPDLIEKISQSQDFETFKRLFVEELGGER
ncbi:BglG family transcription antiterminator [Streptococcus rifensis]